MEWTLQKRTLKELHANPKNPRRISATEVEDLTISLVRFGVCEPIVINSDGGIIGGHQRVRILKKLGHKEIDVYVPTTLLSEEEANELNIRLNKSGGDFDIDILANCWDPEDLVEWGFSLEELHLEILPDDEGGDESSPPKRCTMTITFLDVAHLQEAENEISTIVDAYPGAFCKVKVS